MSETHNWKNRLRYFLKLKSNQPKSFFLHRLKTILTILLYYEKDIYIYI